MDRLPDSVAGACCAAVKHAYATYVRSETPQPLGRLPYRWRGIHIPVFWVCGTLYMVGDYGEPLVSVSASAARRFCTHHKLTFAPAGTPELCDVLAFVKDHYDVGDGWKRLVAECFATGDWGILHEDIVAALKRYQSFILTHVLAS